MCGITAIIRRSENGIAEDLALMSNAQLHRGPDASGIKVFNLGDRVVGLGHQRLSILDLSPRGNQPMLSPCGRYAIVFNGEIYNYIELRSKLDADDPILGVSDSDTAVLLALLVRYGPQILAELNGMWAFLFLDLQEGRLLGSRDRFGQKPLYWYSDGKQLILASEIKSILVAAKHKCHINYNTVARYLSQSLLSTDEQTFFTEVKAVPACTYFEISLRARADLAPTFKRYWQHPVELGQAESASVSPQEFREVLINSVKVHLRSDVPVGILLSGGIDSSALLACTKHLIGLDTVKVLSIVSSDKAADESYFIDLTAKSLGCGVEKVHFNPKDDSLFSEIEQVLWHNGQPVASLSALAHRLLMKRAKDLGIKVLLNGQGADEQLAGYSKFLFFHCINLLRSGHPVESVLKFAQHLFNGTVLPSFHLTEAKRYVPFLRDKGARQYLGPALKGAHLVEAGAKASLPDRMLMDLQSTSLPAILHYEDRSSMAFSLEMRVPFLDSNLVELIGRLPTSDILAKGWTKYILRRSLKGLLPDEIIWRKDKRGFTVPQDPMIRGVWCQRFRDTFNDDMLAAKAGLVNANGAKLMLNDFLNPGILPFYGYKDPLHVFLLEHWLRAYQDYLVL